MSHLYRAIAVAAFTACVSLPSYSSGIVYSQMTDLKAGYASQNDTTGGNGNFATAYDNFTLGASYDIDGFGWTGSYFNPPTQGTITAFTLTFYSDALGAPGAVIWSGSGAGNFGETSIGNDVNGSPTYVYFGGALGGFTATANTQYWVSIVADLGFPPQWGWESGTGGDGMAYQSFLGTSNPIEADLAFDLTGTPAVPEPSSYALFGLGLLGLAGIARRKSA